MEWVEIQLCVLCVSGELALNDWRLLKTSSSVQTEAAALHCQVFTISPASYGSQGLLLGQPGIKVRAQAMLSFQKKAAQRVFL